MTIRTRAVPNLIQGVSQQAPMQRRDTQCEEQFDCMNSPVDGCVARLGSDLIKFLSGTTLSGAFFFDIRRSASEWYLGVVYPGVIRVFDLADFTECTVNVDPSDAHEAYLTAVSGQSRDAFTATSIDDYTFVANKQIVPAMAGTLSPARPKEALFYFRAGNYQTRFVIAIIYAGTRYTWTYTTPDNSVAGNAYYVTTNQLAATFFKAMTGAAAPVPTSGSSGRGVGATDDGTPPSGWPDPTGGTTAISLGFSMEINGNVIRVWREDGNEFEVETTDGNGDTLLKGVKAKVSSLSDLPNRCFEGFTVKVQGDAKAADDDYYAKYVLDGTNGGYWEETVAPGVPIGLNPDTMPYQLVNTGYRTFTFGRTQWGGRVVGDVDSAPDPSFVGRSIQHLAYDNQRLAILTEAGPIWSKARNPFVFFPDTVQTKLAEAPIDTTVSGTEEVSLLRRFVHKSGATFLWADQLQFSVSSGTQPFTQETVEIKPSTSFEVIAQARPCGVAQSLFFASTFGSNAIIRDLYVTGDQRTAPQDTDVTGHVPRYIPNGVRWLAASDLLSLLFVQTDGAPQNLYVYNWLISGEQRPLSAWNTWRFPASSTILWIGTYRSATRVLIQRPDGLAVTSLTLGIRGVDTEPGATYATRMDMRIRESAFTSITYDAGTNRTTITMPYALTGGTPLVAVRDDDLVPSGGRGRGHAPKILSVGTNTIVLAGDYRGHHFYVGFRIRSERLESRFFLRDEAGSIPAERLQVRWIDYVHARTGYYRVEVSQKNGQQWSYPFEGRVMGDAGNILDTVVLDDGHLHVPVNSEAGQVSVRLVNDSFLPSAWQSAVWAYEAVVRAPPDRGSGA